MARAKHTKEDPEGAAMAAALRRYAAKHDLTQSRLAAKLNTSQSTVSRLLKNQARPDPELRRKVSVLLTDDMKGAVGSDEWVQMVARLAKTSDFFRELIALGLRHLSI